MSYRADYEDYPFLNREEFEEVCHYIDRLYRQAKLGPDRRRWKLDVITALQEGPFSLALGSSTYVKIERPLHQDAEDGELMSTFGRLELGRKDEALNIDLQEHDMDMLDAEEADQEAVPRRRQQVEDVTFVSYEIHLHPTYRAPCLWFSLHGLPSSEPPLSLDTVLKYLVPEQLKETVLNIGPIRGISIDNNPSPACHASSFIPVSLVKPCRTSTAPRRAT